MQLEAPAATAALRATAAISPFGWDSANDSRWIITAAPSIYRL